MDTAGNALNNENVFTGKTYRITVLSERLLRFEYNAEGKFFDGTTHFAINKNFPKFEYKKEEDNKYLVISTKYFSLQYAKDKPFKGPSFAPDSNLRVKLNNTDKLWYMSHPEARNYKSTAISLDDFANIKLEKGLYSTDGFVTVDDSKGLIINSDGSLIKREDKNLDFYLFMYKRDFGLCLYDYFTLTGFPAMLPKYALGIWWNRDRIYSDNDIVTMINLFNKHDIPLSVMLLSEFWHIKDDRNPNLYKTGYTFNNKLFPDPKQLTDYLGTKNIKLGINIDPSEGIRKEEPSYNSFAASFNVTDGKNVPFNIFDKTFVSKFLDELLNPLLREGIAFFWLDYVISLQGLEALNYYVYNNYKNISDKRPLLLTRNSLVASHRYPVLYSGETVVSWDTLKYLPFYNSNSSNIGVTHWSHDVGGFKDGVEDSELYLRYVQFSCFSPIFRFSAKRGPYYKREPWLWDMKTFTIVKNFCQLRYKLIPYIYSESYNYHKTGLPIVQPLYYNNPELFDEPEYKNEYYFGKEFLIAPITKTKDIVMNRSVERIFLPSGTWYDFFTGKKFLGDKRYVTFYKDETYPIFVREGAIIPMAVFDKNKNDISNPKSLEINVFPGKSNTYKLYEDDGITNSYENGAFNVTTIDYNYMSNNYTLIIYPFEGDSSLVPEKRNYFIKFRNTKEASDVSIYLNGDHANNIIEKYADEVDFYIKIYDVDVTKQLTINCKGNNIEIDAVRIINEDINLIISDLSIPTHLKEQIGAIIFSNKDIKRKRILVNKLKKQGLTPKFTSMFLKLLEYVAEI